MNSVQRSSQRGLAIFLLRITFAHLRCAAEVTERPTNVYAAATVAIVPGDGEDINLREGDDMVLKCLTGGHPKPTTKWLIMGGELERRPLDLDNSELILTNIQRNEGGRITCRADNGIDGVAWATVRLNVFYISRPILRLYKSKNERVAADSMWYENTVVLRCETRSNPESTVTWYKNGRLIKAHTASADGMQMSKLNGYKQDTAVYLLKIRNASEKHYGNYECNSSLKQTGVKYNIPDAKINFTFDSNVVEPTITVTNPHKVVANVGQDILLECCVRAGYPPVEVAWIRENEIISAIRIFSHNKKILRLPNIQVNDAGSYFCVGDNYVGIPVKKKVEVVVRYIRSMSYWITPDSLSDEKKLELNKYIQLTCHCDAQPPEELQYSWYKKIPGGNYISVNHRNIPNNVFISSIKEDEVRRFVTYPAYSSRLEIFKSVKENYGSYLCQARLIGAPNGTAQVEATIIITQDSAPAQVFADQDTITVREGAIALLKCRSRGRPVPGIRWLRDGNITIDDDRVRITKNGYLKIRNVSREDADVYTCMPSLENGFSKLAKRNHHADIALNVKYPPDVVPLYVVKRRRLGIPLSLSCVDMSENPQWGLTYTWKKNGRIITRTSGEMMTFSPLERQNYGLYECVVENDAGSSRCLVNVTGATFAPEFYYTLEDAMKIHSIVNTNSARNSSSKSGIFVYILSWTQKLSSWVDPVTEYRIRWRRKDSDDSSSVPQWLEDKKIIEGAIGEGELISYKMRDLAAGVYDVEVTPKNSFGYGDTATRTITARKKRGPQTTIQGPSFFCHFGTADICGFKQELSKDNSAAAPGDSLGYDDFDWTLNSEITQVKRTENTGPDVDHSSSTKNGGYMYIESSNTRKNEKARLVSPIIMDETTTQQCLKFFYHMWGRDIGRLNVIIRTGGEKTVWTKVGSQGNRWIPALVPLFPRVPYQVVFEATILKPTGFNYLGDIAIDDVMLENGPCPTTPPMTEEQQRTSPGNGGKLLSGWPIFRTNIASRFLQYICDDQDNLDIHHYISTYYITVVFHRAIQNIVVLR